MEEQAAGLLDLSSERRRHSSSSSTPYESAACSPRSSTDKAASSYYSVSAPSYPVTITCDIGSLPVTGRGFVIPSSDASFCEEPLPQDFDFSARFSETDLPWSPTPMSSADELFCNGQIRPLWYNCEDLIYLSSADHANKVNDDDEDNHFDFQSSADYKFSTLSDAYSHTLPRHSGFRYTGPSLDEDSVDSYGQVCKEGKEDAGEVQRMNRLVEKWRASSRQGHHEIIAKQAMMVQVDEGRGRHARGNKEGGIRRSRSLSPLRVFHMDDELPRQSVDTGGQVQEEEQRTQTASSKGRRLTLKELLHSSSRTEQRSNSKRGEKQQDKAYTMEMEKKMKERNALCFKYSAKQALGNKVKGSNHAFQHPGHHQASMSPHGLHYGSHTDQIRQQTFLPYRHGLLGCLGLTSKSYHSVAGIQNFQCKSQGRRQSTRYDS